VGTAGAIHIRPDFVPHAYFRAAPLWRMEKDYPWQLIGPEGLGSPLPEQDVDRAAERASWGRRAALDLLDAIAEDREAGDDRADADGAVRVARDDFAGGIEARDLDRVFPRGDSTRHGVRRESGEK